MTTALAMVAAVLLDAWLGEPRRLHPLVAFGRLAGVVESRLYRDRRASGIAAWCVVVLPIVMVVLVLGVWLMHGASWLWFVYQAVMLYLVIGLRSLSDHAMPVARALEAGDILGARTAVGRMVSRDTAALDDVQVAAAATESVLENGNDAVFGALFWFAMLGVPGAVLYRLANTLDAMWGYRTERYECFGWAAARFDDVLNFLPARLTALSYGLLGDASRAWRCWRAQAPQWDSPNAGPVMAAGAGALGVCLGGAAPYDGVWEPRPALGEGEPADARSIVRALQLVRRGVVLWLAAMVVLGIVRWGAAHA